MSTNSTTSQHSTNYQAKTGANVEVASHLLTASGVLAICLAGYFNIMAYGLWPQILIYIIFTAVFVALSHSGYFELSEQTKLVGIVTLLVLCILSWLESPSDIVLILTVVMMATAPYAISRKQCWLLMLVTNITYLAVSYFYWNSNYIFLSWMSMFALQAFAITSSLARVQESHLKQQLFEQNIELVEARSALAQKSQMQERLRIAGDLHDSIGHQLTALRLQLEALNQLAPEELKPKVAVSQQLSSDLLENIRSIVKRMALDEPTDLVELVKSMNSETPGVEITISSSLPSIQSELNQQLIPSIKEGVSNAIRHSGADIIEISFDNNHIFIDDNGSGLAADNTEGFGLRNLKQRLAEFGGQVDLKNKEHSGCRLAISVATGINWEAQQ